MQFTVKYFTVKCIVLSALICVAAQPANSSPADDNILPPLGHTYFCLRYPHDCERTVLGNAPPALFAVRWQKLNSVNALVNATIVPKSDPPVIAAPWRIAPREGICDDYAVTKRHELLEAGWPSSSLLLAEVTLISTGQHHLVLIVKDPEGVWVLDNLHPVILTFAATRTQYTWNRVESADNPRIWTKSFASLR